MAMMKVYDTETNKPLGEIEIPDDVIEAAVKVEAYLKHQPRSMAIYGVKLADENE